MLEDEDEALGALLLGSSKVEDDMVEQLAGILQQVMASSSFFLFLPLLFSFSLPSPFSSPLLSLVGNVNEDGEVERGCWWVC